MNASRTPISAPKARPASACAVCSAPLRSSQGFSGTKARPAFWPEPLNEKPSTLTILSTSGCFMKNCSTCDMAASVRACEAPGGNCTLTIR
jgi:hypothetical protein